VVSSKPGLLKKFLPNKVNTKSPLIRWLLIIFIFLPDPSLITTTALAKTMSEQFSIENFRQQILQHPGKSAAYVLERGEEALLARAWLADHAQKSIEVQYFIWSSDNIGTLATESLLRAADRGVNVRVIVDDLLIDAPDKTLLALAKHPNIGIRIYNPKHSVGTPFHKRVINLLTDFRGFNQRMHDKVFIVDNDFAITGGRNMADEYFDFDHEYNFRDRDVLLLGSAVKEMRDSFERFWLNPISIPAEELYDGIGIMQKHVVVDDQTVQNIYKELHHYAQSPENFEPEIRQSIQNIPNQFKQLSHILIWGDIDVINDIPGKNDNKFSLGGGSRSATALANLLKQAKSQIIIQSPYLILPHKAKVLFRDLIKQGIKIQISTNSLASTDNLQAFSGYRSQRKSLLKMGVDIYEFKPNAANQQQLMQRYQQLKHKKPKFALHAKTIVIDSKIAYIGTFNLDPRSINLNTETGVIIHNEKLAKQVEAAIRQDMLPDNSWNARRDDPDSHSSLIKRSRTLFWQLMPINPLL